MFRLSLTVAVVLFLSMTVNAQSVRDTAFKQSQKRADSTTDRSAKNSVTVYSLQSKHLPSDFYYVVRGNNLYQVWKKTNGSWDSSWALCELDKSTHSIRFRITWEQGLDEVGELKNGIYSIVSHDDKPQVGTKHSMKRSHLPSSAIAATNVAIKRSFPLKATSEQLQIANLNLDVAEQGLSNKTRHATDTRGILRRQRQISINLDIKNAGLYLGQ